MIFSTIDRNKRNPCKIQTPKKQNEIDFYQLKTKREIINTYHLVQWCCMSSQGWDLQSYLSPSGTDSTYYTSERNSASQQTSPVSGRKTLYFPMTPTYFPVKNINSWTRIESHKSQKNRAQRNFESIRV